MSKNKRALIIVDVQQDFCPGGKLAVKNGDKVVEPINKLMREGNYDVIVSTLDTHPQNHKSFASNNEGKKPGEMGELGGQPQVMWADHCVENTPGCEYHPALLKDLIQYSVKKGQNPEVDSYSGFFDNDKKSTTGLNEILLSLGVVSVDVVGLALDYCVQATALDAKRLGFETAVLLKATRAVNLAPNDDKKVIKTLQESGIKVKA